MNSVNLNQLNPVVAKQTQFIQSAAPLHRHRNQDKADALLRGTASDEVFTETRQSEEGINARVSTETYGDKDGDVIWSTVQESRGDKFRGASADSN